MFNTADTGSSLRRGAEAHLWRFMTGNRCGSGHIGATPPLGFTYGEYSDSERTLPALQPSATPALPHQPRIGNLFGQTFKGRKR
ncbi:hypothetical protein NHX12_012669 [Muraenolepis orangiensis]|uniref:Uncharacterized protein n=1 Tax=Muraenolepis orangiensis TaxID=630683 RepID=A0A9Q0I541_9TELE|nr:hypothetical protein NHX12_012669 [Muraenolepis orangiensis]